MNIGFPNGVPSASPATNSDRCFPPSTAHLLKRFRTDDGGPDTGACLCVMPTFVSSMLPTMRGTHDGVMTHADRLQDIAKNSCRHVSDQPLERLELLLLCGV
jgi:hypothetical protein